MRVVDWAIPVRSWSRRPAGTTLTVIGDKCAIKEGRRQEQREREREREWTSRDRVRGYGERHAAATSTATPTRFQHATEQHGADGHPRVDIWYVHCFPSPCERCRCQSVRGLSPRRDFAELWRTCVSDILHRSISSARSASRELTNPKSLSAFRIMFHMIANIVMVLYHSDIESHLILFLNKFVFYCCTRN